MLTATNEVLLLAIATIFSVAFACFVLFSTRQVYAPWAKLTAILACAADLVWAGLGLFFTHSQSAHLTRHAFLALHGLKQLFGGLALGFILSILFARPYRQKDVETPTA